MRVLFAIGAFAAVTLVPAAPAQAEAPRGFCDWQPPISTGKLGHPTFFEVKIKTGPSAYCPGIASALPEDRLIYWCYGQGEDGTAWTYLTKLQDGTTGWTRSEHLVEGGAQNACE
ncbi:hypothetical protein [Longispora urticae]